MVDSTALYRFLEQKNHTTQDLIDEVYNLTGIMFEKGHPLYNFYTMPASTKFHGCQAGGLVEHSLRVYWCALQLASAFSLPQNKIDANACIFHDLVKVDAYKWDAFSSSFKYNYDAVNLPHGSESLLRMHKYNIPISNRGWELAVAYHMGAFEHDNMSAYSNACKKYKEVLLLHTADMMASQIYQQ